MLLTQVSQFDQQDFMNRRNEIENECIKLRLGKESALDVFGEEFKPQVNIDQFYGIEINDFAVTVAKTALWIAECQMMEDTSKILNRNLNFLPLKKLTPSLI